MKPAIVSRAQLQREGAVRCRQTGTGAPSLKAGPGSAAHRSAPHRARDTGLIMPRSTLPGTLIALAVLAAGFAVAFLVGRFPVSLADIAAVLWSKLSGAPSACRPRPKR